MKTRKLTTALTAITLTAGYVSAELKAYDGFSVPLNYKQKTELNGQSGGTGFGPWSVDLSSNKANGRRYLATDKVVTHTDSKGNALQTAPGRMTCWASGSGKGAIKRDLNKALSGTIWISFLTQLDEQTGYGWDIQFLDEQGTMLFKVMNGRAAQNHWRIQSAKLASGNPKDGLFKSTAGMTPVDPTLIILKVENAGSGKENGSVTAYLNPGDLRDAELTAMASVKIKGLPLNAIKTFSFDKKSNIKGYIDELRIGETIADVLPLQQ